MAHTIVFKKKKFNSKSVLKSKTADDLVKRYAILYPKKMAEADVRELFAIANPVKEKAAAVAAVKAETTETKK
jgi:hypothetical protein